VSGVTYDTGALLVAEAGRRALWALHARALQRGALPTVPAGVLAQAWRGGSQPQLSRLLRGCHVEDLDEGLARTVGAACARSSTTDVVDTSVVVGALQRRDLVVTSDSEELRTIANGMRRRLDIHAL
jgi:hypothetical protein